MALGSIVLGIALLGVLAVVVAWPWLRPVERYRARRREANPRLAYEALVASIRDLDFDYQAGVVTEEDYRVLREDLTRRAAALLQELDRRTRREIELERQIEEMVSALRTQRRRPAAQTVGDSACPQCGQTVRPGDRFCAHCGAKLAYECPNCGKPVAVGDRFCTDCGRPLVEEVTVTS